MLGRREFLIAGLLAGAGLLIGVHVPFGDPESRSNSPAPDCCTPNAWVTLHPDEMITIRVHHSEMGQGIATTLAMIVAEELDADWSRVRFEHAPVDAVFRNPLFDMQWTVSSRSVETSWDILRQAGATVRQMLVNAAAAIWQVENAACITEAGQVLHPPSGRCLRYGELTQATRLLSVPESVSTKKPEQFKLIGTTPQRLDGPEKITGQAVFGLDVHVPDMLIATVLHPPRFGSFAESVNMTELLRLPGVIAVHIIETGVAIIGRSFWQVQQAMAASRISWSQNTGELPDSGRLFERWDALGRGVGRIMHEVGDPEVLDQAAQYISDSQRQVLEAVYELPYQAHATPEPMNCTAHVRKDGCEVWASTQNQQGAREIAARLTGLAQDAVTIHTTYLGGGFGRRAVVDYVGEAVELAKAMQVPVKVIWTREEDMRHDFYRPATHNRMRAVVDASGIIQAWQHRIVGADVFSHLVPELIPARLPDWIPRTVTNMGMTLAHATLPGLIAGRKAILGAGPLPYHLANMRVEFINDDPGVPLGWWRSVAHSSNCFAVECFLDEIAAATHRDPLQIRLDLLTDCPRLRTVLELAADRTPWYQAPAPGIHRGIACHDFQDTMMAMVAEISLAPDGNIQVRRMVCAVDCGRAVTPGIIAAQVQSGICFGLTATFKGGITIVDGAVREGNFDDFPLLRFDEMPLVETHIVLSDRPPSGMGEVPVPLVAPAIANAIFAATGQRIRRLPVTKVFSAVQEQ